MASTKQASTKQASTKQNTPGLGIEYEVHLPAYFALLLNTNPEIEDFILRSNVQGFGNLDDLLVDIKTKSGKNLYFAFQLKHKEKSSGLLPTNFEAKGDFNLEKYCVEFKKLSAENREKYHIILYTNKNFDSSPTDDVNKIKNFYIKQDVHECCLGINFFDTSGDGNNLYKFEVKQETDENENVNKKDYEEFDTSSGDGNKSEGKQKPDKKENVNKKDYEEFFSKFSLYTGQADFRDLANSHILKILKYKDCYVRYIEFFRKWHRGDFTDINKKKLDKKTLNIHLVDIFLSSVAKNFYLSDGQDKNSIFFEKMVQEFDITIIDTSKKEFIKQFEENAHRYPEKFNKEEDMLRWGKDNKFIDRSSNNLTEETELKLLRYFYQKPLILDFNESSKDFIYEASKLCKLEETGIKLVIMGENIDVSKFSHLKVFTNLTEVDGNFLEETKERCKLFLQGRIISFKDIFEEKFLKFVTPREIFQMLKGSFSIGEDNENLPACYIPRTVSTTVFDIESVIKQSLGSVAIIFYYEGKFEELKILIKDIVKREDYLYEDFLDGTILRKKVEHSKKQLQQDESRGTLPEIPAIILRREECSRKQLKKIREEIGKDDVHSFKVIDEMDCLLLMSTRDTTFKENYESTKRSVEENNIHVFFNNSINLLCAQPGMGKSTLMKYLKTKCDSNFWTVMVDLKTHNQFLRKKNRRIKDVLTFFLELKNYHDLFLLSIKKMFLDKQKIVFFLDGLDEVENECIDYVLNITSQLSEMGFRIWLSSRQNLQQKIEHWFNALTVEIDELNENQQKKYIEERLMSLYKKNEIEEIVEKVYHNTDLANNCQILAIPLQLHIITQIFLDDKSYYSNFTENNFILTKMLEIFFEGKYKHYFDKIELKHTHLLGTLEEQLEKYETVALHSVLDDQHFEKLQIEKKSKLTKFKKKDYLGIITKIDGENKAVFEHLTFAEYFASKYLVKNFEKARILKEEIFTEKYQNLLLIFNIMLAEDSPLHLAIIYKDLSQIQKFDESFLVDKGGRNCLQVAACVATRHPPLESYRQPSSSECLVKDKSVQKLKGEDSKIREIVNRVLSSEPFNNDKIFEWNSVEYALVNGTLYIVEAILEKFEKPPNFYEILVKYYSDEVVAYYSIRFGYHRLLSEILIKKSCHVTKIVSDYLWYTQPINRNNSIFHFLFFKSDCTNRTTIVELLTGDDINKTVYDIAGYTFLHFAVFHEDIEILNFLQQKIANVNVTDINGSSPLFLAVERKNLEILKILVEKGADVNIKNTIGNSPLFYSVKQNSFEISKMLVEREADVNILNTFGKTPLLYAFERNNLEISKLLVEKGADVNVKDKNGCSALFWAVYQNNLKILKFLIEKGADVNIKNKDGQSPLFSAVDQSNLEISKFLIEKGADINIKDRDGWSPLFVAVKLNNPEISKFLIEKGADITLVAQNQELYSSYIGTTSVSLSVPVLSALYSSYAGSR